jgi:hypothetical protein
VPQWKASPLAWMSALVAGLAGCYSPDIPAETSDGGSSGTAPGSDLRGAAPTQQQPGPKEPSISVKPLQPVGAGGSATELTPPLQPPLVPPPVLPAPCEPQLSISEVLPAGCAGEVYFARLGMQCGEVADAAAPVVQWRPSVLPNGLTLSARGELLGGSELAAGSHELRVRALIGDVELPVTLQLEVLERCWVFAAAQQAAAEAASPTRILAQRLDGASEALWLPENLPAESSISSLVASWPP